MVGGVGSFWRFHCTIPCPLHCDGDGVPPFYAFDAAGVWGTRRSPDGVHRRSAIGECPNWGVRTLPRVAALQLSLIPSVEVILSLCSSTSGIFRPAQLILGWDLPEK